MIYVCFQSIMEHIFIIERLWKRVKTVLILSQSLLIASFSFSHSISVESPPSYDDIFNGRSTPLSSPVLTDEPGLSGHRSPVGEEGIQVRVEEEEEET